MLDRNKRYSVKGWRGVAFHFVGYPQVWVPYTYLEIDPETSKEYEVPGEDGEWEDDIGSGWVLMVMVGDDYKHKVEECDCQEIASDDYCHECGQIGCTADGRS